MTVMASFLPGNTMYTNMMNCSICLFLNCLSCLLYFIYKTVTFSKVCFLFFPMRPCYDLLNTCHFWINVRLFCKFNIEEWYDCVSYCFILWMWVAAPWNWPLCPSGQFSPLQEIGGHLCQNPHNSSQLSP